MNSFPISRGTNISHWLSQSTERGEERRRRFTREDVARLADLGLDHLRLPIDEEQMWNEADERESEAWDLLEQGLDWCQEAGLRAIVDLHILRSHHFNGGGGNTLFSDPAAEAHFADCWRDLSAGLRSRANDLVAYEVLNEPVAADPADWNRVLRAPYAAIRAEEPERVIAIGSNRFCSVGSYPDFSPPEEDPRLILVFHYYNPMLITHYTAPWCPGLRDYAGPIQYPGRPIPVDAFTALDLQRQQQFTRHNAHYDRSVMAASIAPVLAKAAAMGLPLWCNEFGVYHQAPDAIRMAWYRDFRSVLEEHGIAWANWDFRGGFGLFGRDDHQPTVVVDALLGE